MSIGTAVSQSTPRVQERNYFRTLQVPDIYTLAILHDCLKISRSPVLNYAILLTGKLFISIYALFLMII